MSNRLFQGVIYQMKDAFDRVIGVIDENGVVISCSDLGKMGNVRQGIREELSYSNDFVTREGYTYRYMGVGQKCEYIVFIEGEDKLAEKIISQGGKATWAETVEDGVRLAVEKAEGKVPVLALGSLYMYSELKTAFDRLYPNAEK